jgi:plastocyanin
MSNWDLMMPGMGLTAIGLAGVSISYMGLAHTFIDGMHALTGLTMFIGLIFLAAGILDGGISTSNRAKATVLVVASISLGFGMFAFTMNTIESLNIAAGLLIAIAFPAIVIAYVAAKMPTRVKPIGAIVMIAATTGIVTFVAFGFISPDTYIIAEEIEEVEEIEVELTGPIVPISILVNSAVQGNPDYDPDVAYVPKGSVVEWTNADLFAHTVTSSVDVGETFDSGLLSEGETFQLDTNELEVEEYEYYCIVHPWMVSKLIIEEPKEPVTVIMPEGAGIQQEGQIYYDPEVLQISVGTPVLWLNEDSAMHTVTSGNPQEGPNGVFDSDLMAAGDSFEFTFTSQGKEDYYCIVHPWMVGSVEVG